MHSIVKLEIENVKQVRALTVVPDGANLVLVSGHNGAGKSSTLDAIQMALGGKRCHDAQPVTIGEATAQVILETGDLIIRRWWTGGGANTYLEVTGRDGRAYKSAQETLDRMYSVVSFDPLAFAAKPAAEQRAMLLTLAGIDTTELDAQARAAFDEQRVLNRQVADLEAQVEALPAPVAGEAKTIDLTQAVDAFNEAQAHNRMCRRARAALEDSRREVHVAEQHLQEAERLLADRKSELAEYETKAERLGAEIDIAPLEQSMALAKEQSARAAQIHHREAKLGELVNVRRLAQAQQDLLDAAKQAKADLLASAPMPLPELTIGDEGVLLSGVPFAQASSGEQLRASVGIGFALNPDLRVLLVRQGSLLDSEGLRLVAEAAEAAGGQVWLERVSDGDLKVIIGDEVTHA